MSLLNAAIMPGRAIIATDTAFRIGGEEVGRKVSKCFALPHLPLVVAFRGQLYFGASLWSGMLHVAARVDEILDHATAIVSESFHLIRRHGAPAPALGDQQQVVIAAFDERAGRMRGLHLEQQDIAAGFICTEIPSTLYAPGGDWLNPPENPATAATMIEVARAQVVWVRNNVADAAIGGELILTTIDQFSVRQERAFNLDREK